MENTAVSALQEYCAKTKTGPPTFEFVEGQDGGYVCKVSLMDLCAFGNGRSKRDAKHMGAANLLRNKYFANDKWERGTKVDSVDELTYINRDMLRELRDYCVSHDMPLPIIEIIQQSGSPNAPIFVACCSVASIKRYAKSDKKKDARQRAAIEMLNVISIDANKEDTQLVNLKVSSITNNAKEDLESERRRKFKTYRELTEANEAKIEPVKLCDRHNYFKSFYPHVKEAVFKALNSEDYGSYKDQLDDVFNALRITPCITTLEAKSMEPVLQVKLNCEFDAVFIGLETRIYQYILEYFREMLV